MRRRILLIEDSADIAALVDFHLTDLGYKVTSVVPYEINPMQAEKELS